MSSELIRAYIKLMLEAEDDLQVEFSSIGGGAIQGYTLPLGMKPGKVPTPKVIKKKRKLKK